MLFNSFAYIVLFLPLTFAVYFILNKKLGAKAGHLWLVAASLFFYAYWDIRYLPLLIGSLLINYIVGRKLQGDPTASAKWLILFSGVSFNIALLLYFKYAHFFLENVNAIFNGHISLPAIVLPLGISFFTFTQITYLVDSYKGISKQSNLLEYGLFVTFFPHLLAGPIIHYRNVIPQFQDAQNRTTNLENIRAGIFLFFLGLAKKVVIADYFAVFADAGFNNPAGLTGITAWVAALAYTFQIYFDFSGYTDMAIGASLLFNIKLPQNFNSPYRAVSIQDFWRRWHITLSDFLREYLYFPLGGSRKGEFATYRNLFVVFLLGGLWHGAGWTFVIWGALHGLATTIHRAWQKTGIKLPVTLAWAITFFFIVITWVFFRANSVADALAILSHMFSFAGFGSELAASGVILAAISLALIGVLVIPNSQWWTARSRPTLASVVMLFGLFLISFYSLNHFSQFIYFNF